MISFDSDRIHSHFVVYKPDGYISQFISNQKGKKKYFLGDLHSFPTGIMAIGRLDEQSEGLLLVTTNGSVSFEVRSKQVEKEYYVQVDGCISDDAMQKLQSGITITLEDGECYQTLPCQVSKLGSIPDFYPRRKKVRDDRHGPTTWISIILCEGKNRQIRRMTSSVGYPTLRLVRVRIGGIVLGEMKPGQVVEIHDMMHAIYARQHTPNLLLKEASKAAAAEIVVSVLDVITETIFEEQKTAQQLVLKTTNDRKAIYEEEERRHLGQQYALLQIRILGAIVVVLLATNRW